MQVSVQKLTRTTRPRSSAGSRGSELSQLVAPPSEGNCVTVSTGRLPHRPESGAKLRAEELGLFPGREVPALGDPVVVNEVGVRLLRPALRSLVELLREDADSDRDLRAHALDAEERELVLRVKA